MGKKLITLANTAAPVIALVLVVLLAIQLTPSRGFYVVETVTRDGDMLTKLEFSLAKDNLWHRIVGAPKGTYTLAATIEDAEARLKDIMSHDLPRDGYTELILAGHVYVYHPVALPGCTVDAAHLLRCEKAGRYWVLEDRVITTEGKRGLGYWIIEPNEPPPALSTHFHRFPTFNYASAVVALNIVVRQVYAWESSSSNGVAQFVHVPVHLPNCTLDAETRRVERCN